MLGVDGFLVLSRKTHQRRCVTVYLRGDRLRVGILAAAAMASRHRLSVSVPCDRLLAACFLGQTVRSSIISVLCQISKDLLVLLVGAAWGFNENSGFLDAMGGRRALGLRWACSLPARTLTRILMGFAVRLREGFSVQAANPFEVSFFAVSTAAEIFGGRCA